MLFTAHIVRVDTGQRLSLYSPTADCLRDLLQPGRSIDFLCILTSGSISTVVQRLGLPPHHTTHFPTCNIVPFCILFKLNDWEAFWEIHFGVSGSVQTDAVS